MTEQIEKIQQLANEAKKEVERLEDKRTKQLGNSINYVENEIQIQRMYASIDAYQEALDILR